MTLLTICQDVANEVGVLQPSTIVSNSDAGAVKLLRYANKVGKLLMESADWQVLRKERTFTAVATETQTSILPSDFNRFVEETFWDRTNKRIVTGPISAVEWASLKANSYSGESKRFIHRGDVILTIPVFAGGESLAFEYISKNWCQSSGGTAQNAWAADTDTGILDEELLRLALVYVYLDSEGLPTDSARATFMDKFDKLLRNETASVGVMVAGDIFDTGRHFAGSPSSNTDLGLF